MALLHPPHIEPTTWPNEKTTAFHKRSRRSGQQNSTLYFSPRSLARRAMAEMEVEESLVTRRSRRSTAGNRMQAALAEMSINDLAHDAEDDIDFVIKVDEEDAFESDFASTEEEENPDEEAGERALEEEERLAKRAARQKVWKTPNVPRRVAFESPVQNNRDAAGPSSVKSKTKPARRVSLGQTIDAETGEVMETPLGKRKSTREATRINTQEVQSRMKDAENRRVSVSLTKRPKETKRRKTQADLIAAALDLEEENIKSHREYLTVEEERRKKARVVKPVTLDPKVRWRSRIEDVTVTVYDPVPPPPPTYPPRPPWPSPYTPGMPYTPYVSTLPGQPSPAAAPYPYTPYNIPPPAPATTTTLPATSAPTPPPSISTAAAPLTSTPIVPPPSTTTVPPPSTPTPPIVRLPQATAASVALPSAPATTTPAVKPLPRPPTSLPPPSNTSTSSAPVPPPSMPPSFLPPLPSPAPLPSRPKTPPNPSKTAVPATPVVPTSTSPITAPIPASAPTTTPTPIPATVIPGTSNAITPYHPPPTTPHLPFQYAGYYPYSYYSPTPPNRPGQSQLPYVPYSPYYPYTPNPAGQYGLTRPHLQLQPQQQVARKTTEKQTKNYVEVLLDEERPKEKPSWRETMDSLFGKHADWDAVRVYVGKNRPLSRQIQTCPITGLSARYRDPRTGVPYANLGAFRILSRLLAHEYVWSPTGAPGGVFVGHEKQRGAIGVPDSWADAMAGIPPKRPDPPPPPPPPKTEDKPKKEMKAKETQRPHKEVRVGERRSSRIAAETMNSLTPSGETDKMNMD